MWYYHSSARPFVTFTVWIITSMWSYESLTWTHLFGQLCRFDLYTSIRTVIGVYMYTSIWIVMEIWHVHTESYGGLTCIHLYGQLWRFDMYTYMWTVMEVWPVYQLYTDSYWGLTCAHLCRMALLLAYIYSNGSLQSHHTYVLDGYGRQLTLDILFIKHTMAATSSTRSTHTYIISICETIHLNWWLAARPYGHSRRSLDQLYYKIPCGIVVLLQYCVAVVLFTTANENCSRTCVLDGYGR
jgi:hypothetical protein